MNSIVRTRVAPSPTGDPHIGTAYVSLFDYALARKNNGQFILRIEDTDRSRYVEGSEQQIFESLRWLGLDYDEGPDIGGPYSPYRQSERKSLYHKYALELVAKNKAYYCFCSSERLDKVREEQKKNKEVPRYDRFCRELSAGELERNLNEKKPYVIRLKVPETLTTEFEDVIRGKIVFENKDIDDQVLLKSDGFPTYHLAVVVDDELMKITHVIRAEEWISSTPKHVLLYQAFGWKLPVFAHVPLLRNQDKSKISKRKNPTSLLWYKEQGYLPEAILNFLALMGWSHPQEKEIFSLEEFMDKFSLERVSPSGPVFDLTKLEWLNGEYIRQKTNEGLLALLKPFIKESWDDEKVKQVIPLIKERMKKLSEFPDLVDFFFEEPKADFAMVVQKGKAEQETREILKETAKYLDNDKFWVSHDELEKSMREFAEKHGWSAKDLFMTLRVALTGKTATPPLFDTMLVLGQDEVLTRLTNLQNP